MSDEKPLVQDRVDRARAVLAVHDSGRSLMPESPYEVLRDCVDLIERLTTGLVDCMIEKVALEKRIREQR